ncbi:lipase/acyltransferase domain-containing protein [Nocardia sp. CA-107356]|uniref:lipase/acyltransferase domain-containing protein n=1 Tax=Nocardia sp. CA-107356 TaxID=3239972 RepID=UPI003D93BC4A
MQQDPFLNFFPDTKLPGGFGNLEKSPPVRDAGLADRPLIADAVLVVPGIMGTELVDISGGSPKLLWGLKPGLLSKMWLGSADVFERLKYDPDDTRIVPGRLLRMPAYAPFLKGYEPYTDLIEDLAKVVQDPRAIGEFGYDWRRPVRLNAELLAVAIDEHLRRWRQLSGRPDAKVHLVAHSMGGLLCRALGLISGAMDNVGVTVTLGTPFDGAAPAMVMLGSGEGKPLPAHRMRELARTLPGIYDLLPAYRCLHTDDDEMRELTVDDVVRVGGDRDLARAAFADRELLARVCTPNHRRVIGIAQPTISTITIDRDNRVEGHGYTVRFDAEGNPVRQPDRTLRREHSFGDGTVPRTSEHVENYQTVPQQHGALAQVTEAFQDVRDCLFHHPRSTRLAGGELGLEIPDEIRTGTEFEIGISGANAVTGFKVRIEQQVDDPRMGRATFLPTAERRDDRIVAPVRIHRPGLYRVTVAGAGTSPVKQLILVADGDDR